MHRNPPSFFGPDRVVAGADERAELPQFADAGAARPLHSRPRSVARDNPITGADKLDRHVAAVGGDERPGDQAGVVVPRRVHVLGLLVVVLHEGHGARQVLARVEHEQPRTLGGVGLSASVIP